MNLEQKLLKFRQISLNGCWLWTRGKEKSGYGIVWDYKTGYKVHRIAAQLWLPNFNSKLGVFHKCNTPSCFNPEHLYQGEQSQNIQQCVREGRHWETQKTHCPKGHLYDSKNTRIDSRGRRRCRQCASNYYFSEARYNR